MPPFDIVIIGTGAGGGTMAHALADSPARILIIERGEFIPQEAENWDPVAVWKHLRYQTRETWLDRSGRELVSRQGQLWEDHDPSIRGADRRRVAQRIAGHVVRDAQRLDDSDREGRPHGRTLPVLAAR